MRSHSQMRALHFSEERARKRWYGLPEDILAKILASCVASAMMCKDTRFSRQTIINIRRVSMDARDLVDCFAGVQLEHALLPLRGAAKSKWSMDNEQLQKLHVELGRIGLTTVSALNVARRCVNSEPRWVHTGGARQLPCVLSYLAERIVRSLKVKRSSVESDGLRAEEETAEVVNKLLELNPKVHGLFLEKKHIGRPVKVDVVASMMERAGLA